MKWNGAALGHPLSTQSRRPLPLLGGGATPAPSYHRPLSPAPACAQRSPLMHSHFHSRSYCVCNETATVLPACCHGRARPWHGHVHVPQHTANWFHCSSFVAGGIQ